MTDITIVEAQVLDAINSVNAPEAYKTQWINSFNTFKNSRLTTEQKIYKYSVLMDAITAQSDAEHLGNFFVQIRDALTKSAQDLRDIGAGVLDAAKNITSPTMLFMIAGIVVLYFVLQLRRSTGQ